MDKRVAGKRLFGLTNSYSVVSSSPQEAGRRLFGPLGSANLGRGVLLRNGGRLHVAAADRPEYATPECGSAPELVVHDKAGERILEGLLADTGDIQVLKTSTGLADGSYGCQEDYAIGQRGRFGLLADTLIPFLVTRQLICGAGAVARTPRGAVYRLSRGLPPTARSRSRPLISTRDEPRAAAAGFRRLRVVVSDPAMSEPTTLLKIGATDLVLRMREAAAQTPDLVLDNPVRALEEVSGDITGRSRIRLADGRQLSALDIQREYLATAKDFSAEPADRHVLGLWERALDAIEAGDLGAIAREIDWVIKYRLIEQYRAAHDLPLSAPQVAAADLAYHDIHRGRGLYYQLQRSGAVDRTARDLDIFEAKTVPPAPGRYRQAG